MILIYAAVFILGLVFGSFFNVLVYRLPRKESIVFPASHCPSCNAKIAPYDNIPVLSYIILKGRCRHCAERISPVYPAVELLTGIIFLLIVLKFGITVLSAGLIYSYSTLIVLSFIDIRHREINVYYLIGPAVVMTLILTAGFTSLFSYKLVYFSDIIDSGIGMILGLLLIAIIRLAGKWIMKKEAMGEADIYMAGFMGLLLGYKLFFIALAVGGIAGLLYYPFADKENPEIPFIPFLSLGTFVVQLLSNEILKYIS